MGNIKVKVVKSACLHDNNYQASHIASSDAEIRLGIKKVDEKVKKEARRRKIEAPLSTEEKIFLKR